MILRHSSYANIPGVGWQGYHHVQLLQYEIVELHGFTGIGCVNGVFEFNPGNVCGNSIYGL